MFDALYIVIGLVAIIAACFQLLVVLPVAITECRWYRKFRRGRWEKRGHWVRYPHCDFATDHRASNAGKPDDVEDWF
jgi:hypothetical protein